MLIGKLASTGVEHAIFIEEIKGADAIIKSYIEIIQAVVGCCVHCASTGFGSDVIAQNQWYLLVDKRMLQLLQLQLTAQSRPQHFISACAVTRYDVLHHVSRQHE